MRNLKRALSLALASVMLLGMMVVGTSAASFSDADEIVNKEAVEITAGLGLFAGSDGKFNPKGNVTRAQMATIITKMLYGSEINADQFKGTGTFTDTVSFEGGWAEGYISLCSSLGIVKGYGDGTFKPGNSVTTAEAVTMVINALKVDAGEGTWPLTVMAKSEEMKLFEDLAIKPGTNEVLTRDQLAVIAWNGLNYSAEDVQGYKVGTSDIVFKTWSDAAEYYKALNSTTTVDADVIKEVRGDTLADTIFEMADTEGFIIANQATGEKYTELSNGVRLNIESGLDMLGHYVTAYYAEAYKSEAKPGVAYALVDEYEYITVDETITADRVDYLAVFGSKIERAGNGVVLFDAEGYMAGEAGYNAPTFNYDEDNYTASAGTYAINEDGKIRGFISGITATVEQVVRVSDTAGKESIRIGVTTYSNTADEDEIVEYEGIAKDDIVVVKTYRDAVTYVTKPEVVSGKITKTGYVDNKPVTYIDGTMYFNNGITENVTDMMKTYNPSGVTTYDAYIVGGKLAGVVVTGGAANLTEAIYVIDTYSVTQTGSYGDTQDKAHYAQGIDAEGKEVSILIGIDNVAETDTSSTTYKPVVTKAIFDAAGTNTGLNKFYTFEKSTDREQAKKGVMTATEAKSVNTFVYGTDDFFAGAATVQTSGLTKDDQYVTVATSTACGTCANCTATPATACSAPIAGTARVMLTADTKFVVVEANTSADELEIAVYTGPITRSAQTGDVLTVAATQDVNGANLAQIVVLKSNSVALDNGDYLVITAVDSTGAHTVADNNKEVKVFFSATNEWQTITADTAAAGIYTNYTIDEDGIYQLTSTNVTPNASGAYVYSAEVDSVFNGTLSLKAPAAEVDLFNAADAKVYDVRDGEIVKNADIDTIEALEDIQLAIKDGDYKVYVDVLVNRDGVKPVVTHIFVNTVETKQLDCAGNPSSTWVVDGDLANQKQDCVPGAPVNNGNGTHTIRCTGCTKILSTAAHTHTNGAACACGEPAPAPAPAPSNP